MNIYIKNAGSDIYPLRANTMLPALKYKPDNVCNVRSPTHRPYGLRSDELHKYQLHEYSSTIY